MNLKQSQGDFTMKNVYRLLSVCLSLLLLTSSAFASVGIQRNGVSDGAAANLNLTYPTGSAYTYDGGTVKIPVLSDTLFAVGMATGGATSMASTATAIPTSSAYVRLVLLSDPLYSSKTLANGEPGQLLTISAAGEVFGGSTIALITPTTTVGFTSVQLNAPNDQVVLLYVDDTSGWSLYDYAGSPTITLKN